MIFTASEKECALALYEILIAQANLKIRTRAYWELDISGLYRMKQGSEPAAYIRAEIAKADQHPIIDSRLIALITPEVVPFHGYVFETLFSPSTSGNMAIGKPQHRSEEFNRSFVLTRGGTMFSKDYPGAQFPQTDEEFMSSGWEEVKGLA